MTTELGRVVYTRQHHAFSTRDAVRIIKAMAETKGYLDVADQFAVTLIRYMYDTNLTFLQGLTFLVRLLFSSKTLGELSVKDWLKQLRNALNATIALL